MPTGFSTSAADLGGPISGNAPLIQVPPRPNLADYVFVLPPGGGMVWTAENKPVPEQGLGGQLVSHVARQALQGFLRAEPTGMAVEGLHRAAIDLFNRAPEGVQIAVITVVGLGTLNHVVSNFDSIIQQLGNATYTIDVPVEAIGIRGVKLSLQVALNDFNPSISGVVLQLSRFMGGTLTATASIPTRTLNLGWVLAENLVPGLNLAIQVNGIGLGVPSNPSAAVQFQLTF